MSYSDEFVDFAAGLFCTVELGWKSALRDRFIAADVGVFANGIPLFNDAEAAPRFEQSQAAALVPSLVARRSDRANTV
jgi:hypothetical protein